MEMRDPNSEISIILKTKDIQIQQLKRQIEKMECCFNCYHGNRKQEEYPCNKWNGGKCEGWVLF